jgi:hypothetical protein
MLRTAQRRVATHFWCERPVLRELAITRPTRSTGPNISSLAIFMSGLTLANTVGRTKFPCSSPGGRLSPSITSSAPSSIPERMYCWIRLYCFYWRPGRSSRRRPSDRRSPPAHSHSPPIIRVACRRRRRWVRRALADIPPRRSHPPTAASPVARRSANAVQAPACRARTNSGT